jgi:WhiB family redox-sensing transcriptional regulator
VLELDWYHDAACAGMDTELLYPSRVAAPRVARAVCAPCSVRAECLKYAMEDEDAFAWGVWGGTSPRERWG